MAAAVWIQQKVSMTAQTKHFRWGVAQAAL
jgi:hypothetical protein